MATNTKSATKGLFKVRTDQRSDVRADVLSFEDSGTGYKVSFNEGVGGIMEQKTYFVLGFPDKSPSGNYDVKQLTEAIYKEWSEYHSYDYAGKSGFVTVSYSDSPRTTEGKFDIDMELQGNPVPPGPRHLKVSGTFNLQRT